MIISHLSFSQNGYPKEIVLDKDTLLALKYNQLREINKAIVEGENCKVLLLETEKLVLQQDSFINSGKLLVQNLEAQLKGYEQLVNYKDQQINLRDQEIKKQLKKQKTTKIILGTTIGVSVGIGLGWLIYTFAK